MKIIEAVKRNLANENLYDDELIEIVKNIVLACPQFNDNILTNTLAFKNRSDVYESVKMALTNGVFRIYYSDGGRYEYFDEFVDERVAEETKPANTDIFQNFDEALAWARDNLYDYGKVLYGYCNTKLGSFRAEVYKKIASQDNVYRMDDGLYLKDKSQNNPVDTSFQKQCKQCGELKPASEFHNGRAICKECYNGKRRGSTSQDVSKVQKALLKDYLKEVRKLQRKYIEDLEDLESKYQDELEKIVYGEDE